MSLPRILSLAITIAKMVGFMAVIPWQFFRLKRFPRSRSRFILNLRDRQLCLADAVSTTPFDRHYVYHTAWASRILASSSSYAEHVDISSSLYFVANASAFIPIRFYDYRPAKLALSGVVTGSADLTKLHFASDSIDSLSCMHVVEHIGLGRYGDRIDYDGDLAAVWELKRVTAPGGRLLFVVPIGGTSKIIFNAHRIYTYHQVMAMFEGFDLVEFALIPDDEGKGGLLRNVPVEMADSQQYGCGCFHLRKRVSTS